MAYAGRIGKNDGVKVIFSRNNDGKINSDITIKYYAWNDRTMSSPGYGTTRLKIGICFSPDNSSEGYIRESFAEITGEGGGACKNKIGELLVCGTIVESRCEHSRDRQHRYNILVIKLTPEMEKKFNRTISQLTYSGKVNDEGEHNDIPALLIEKGAI